MDKFQKIKSKAPFIELINIDTDMIIPKQFLTTIKRDGLGENLFFEMRFKEDGSLNSDFILNKSRYADSKILIALDNFGCGSSREHAPWALLDYGIKCVIAPSFADIFYSNCFKNGILPIALDREIVVGIIEFIKNNPDAKIEIDLENQQITLPHKKFKFEIDSFKKKCLLEGLDDIALTLLKKNQISAHEDEKRKTTYWLYE